MVSGLHSTGILRKAGPALEMTCQIASHGTVSPAHGASTELDSVYKSWHLLGSHIMFRLSLLQRTHRPQGELVSLTEQLHGA